MGLFCVPSIVLAQSVQGDLTQMSMEDLMNIELTSAERSRKNILQHLPPSM